MKYKGKTEATSNKEKHVNVYNFTIGKDELYVLADTLADAYRRTPRSLFTQPFTSRLNAMKEEVMKMMKAKGIN